VAFWEQIAKGLLAEEAAGVVGVAPAVGARWFHNAGGMSPFDLKFQPCGRYLSFAEREEIALLKAQDKGVREIARAIGRDPATVSRELRRNAATRGGKLQYRASVAQWKADMTARRPKTAKLVANPRLRAYVQQRLSGQISRPDGTLIAGPQPPTFTGRNKPHRKDRPWSLAWSPEQIANRLKVDFPEMIPCASATRRSTSRSTSRAVARLDVNWSGACAPAVHSGRRGNDHGERPGPMSPRRR